MAKLLASKMELHEHESALPSITHLERDKSLLHHISTDNVVVKGFSTSIIRTILMH